ncbi:MAG: hypothetical protein RR162_01140 [Oscillospiraceae bacterium]
MKKVAVCFSDEEWERVQKLIKLSKRSAPAYLREVGFNGMIYNADYECIRQHTHMIKSLKEEVDAILYTIQSTDEAYNSDIKRVVEILDEIMSNERALFKELQNERAKTRRKISIQVKEAVDLISGGDSDGS